MSLNGILVVLRLALAWQALTHICPEIACRHVQEKVCLLQAQRNAAESEIQTLRGQVMDLGAPDVTYPDITYTAPEALVSAPTNPTATQSAPAEPHTAAASTCESLHPLLVLEGKPPGTLALPCAWQNCGVLCIE